MFVPVVGAIRSRAASHAVLRPELLEQVRGLDAMDLLVERALVGVQRAADEFLHEPVDLRGRRLRIFDVRVAPLRVVAALGRVDVEDAARVDVLLRDVQVGNGPQLLQEKPDLLVVGSVRAMGDRDSFRHRCARRQHAYRGGAAVEARARRRRRGWQRHTQELSEENSTYGSTKRARGSPSLFLPGVRRGAWAAGRAPVAYADWCVRTV